MFIGIKNYKGIKWIKNQLPLDSASILRNYTNWLSNFEVLPMWNMENRKVTYMEER